MTIAFGASGATVNNATAAAVAYPAGISAGDLLVLTAVMKYTATTSDPPTGFVQRGTIEAGAGASAADTGNVRVYVWTRVADGTESGTINVTKTTETGSVILAMMHRYTKSLAFWDIAATTGSDVDGGTAYSAAGATTLDIEAGDFMVAVTGWNTDAPTASAHAFSATGATFASANERDDSGTTTGHDVRLITADAAVTAGPATAAPTYSCTASVTSPEGGTVILRLREAAAVVVSCAATVFRKARTATRRGITGAALIVLATTGAVTVQVPSGDLTLSGFAPTVLNPQTIAVPVGDLTLTGFAPNVGNPVTVEPPAGELTLTGFAPTVVNPHTIGIPVGDLTLTGFAPSVQAGADDGALIVLRPKAHRAAAPPVRKAVTRYTAIGVSTAVSVPIPAGELTLVAFAPTVVVTGDFIVAFPQAKAPRARARVPQRTPAWSVLFETGTAQTVAVPAGDLTLSAFAPTIVTPNTVAVPVADLTLTGFAPVIVNPHTVAIPQGTLTLSGFAPAVNVGGNQTVQPPTADLTLSGFAPTVTAGANQTVAVPVGTLTLEAYAPSLPQSVAPPVGTLTISGFAPSVTATANQFIAVPLGTLALTGFAPGVVTGGNAFVDIPQGTLTLIGYAPQVLSAGVGSDHRIITVDTAGRTVTVDPSGRIVTVDTQSRSIG